MEQKIIIVVTLLLVIVNKSMLFDLKSEKTYEIKMEFFRPVEGSPHDLDYRGVKVERFNRSAHVMTGQLTSNFEIDENIQINLKSYQRRGDEYQESALKFDNESFCTIIEADTFIYPGFAEAASLPLKCPIKAGTYVINNYLIDMSRLPTVIPEGFWLLVAETTRGTELKAKIEIGANVLY